MTFAQKTALSAAIGGTAESLGGGKFANGAVTGAYVIMLNHLGHGGNRQNESDKQNLSLKDKNLTQKLIDEMIVINTKGFEGGNVSELFDEESLIFGKNERWKTLESETNNSIVRITLMNQKSSSDFGNDYQVNELLYL